MNDVEAIKARVAWALRDAGLPTADRPQLVNTWRTSRTATVYHFRVDRSPEHDVVVKLLNTPEHAAVLFNSMCETANALEQIPWEVGLVLRPTGLSEDLGAVIMPHVGGRSLAQILQQDPWASKQRDTDVLKLLHGCGVLLAGYHSQLRDNSEARKQAAWEDIEPRITTVVGANHHIKGLLKHAIVAKNYGDFQPDNLISTPANKLVLIDPPLESLYRYVYRDLALFIYKLFMLLIHPWTVLRKPAKARCHGLLVDAFLTGYSTVLGRPVSNDDRFFINGCEAFLIRRRLRDLWQSRALAMLAYHLAPLERRYRGLRQGMLEHLERRSTDH